MMTGAKSKRANKLIHPSHNSSLIKPMIFELTVLPSVSLCIPTSVHSNLFSSFSVCVSLCLSVRHRAVEVKRKAVQRIEEQLMKLQMQATDREENKQIALGTSKLNYLDPRISVAWYLHSTMLFLFMKHI